MSNFEKYWKDSCKAYLVQCGFVAKALRERCLAKYPRGINIVIVPEEMVGQTFTPHFTVDPGRYFMNYQRISNGEVFEFPLSNEILQIIKKMIDEYDPQKEINFMMVCSGNDSIFSFFRIPVSD